MGMDAPGQRRGQSHPMTEQRILGGQQSSPRAPQALNQPMLLADINDQKREFSILDSSFFRLPKGISGAMSPCGLPRPERVRLEQMLSHGGGGGGIRARV